MGGMGGWQPIETAPRDGRELLLAPHGVVAVWDSGAENWLVMNIPLTKDLRVAANYEPGCPWFEVMVNSFGSGEPTHWMPLPEPPK